MFLLPRQHTAQSNNYCSARISYVSLCLGVIFYYFEGVHQLFFTIIKDGSFNAPISFAYHYALSFGLFAYVLVLAPVYYYYLKTRINLAYRVLLYFLIPSIISFVFWYFYIYLQYSPSTFIISSSEYETFKYILIISYLQGLSILMTIASVTSDITLNLIRFIVHLAKK